MRINFYATIRLMVGQQTVEVSLSEIATFKSLLEELYIRYPTLQNTLTDESGNIRENIHMFINREGIPGDEGIWARVINDDDVVDIFPAIAGGG
jgi:MoaD family protein